MTRRPAAGGGPGGAASSPRPRGKPSGTCPDAIFAVPRLAEIYDAFDGERTDLDLYVRLLTAAGARSVLDVGCGTGTLACLLARRGVSVTAVDPAAASVDVARRKPDARRVDWLIGDATTLPPLAVDAATMTGNVAQVFLADEDWHTTLAGMHDALRIGGTLVFETRDPRARAWEEWTPERTRRRLDLPRVGTVETWTELVSVQLPFVSFRTNFMFAGDGAQLSSDSTLRFWEEAEIVDSLEAAGYRLEDIVDAPDRPGREFVFLASRTA